MNNKNLVILLLLYVFSFGYGQHILLQPNPRSIEFDDKFVPVSDESMIYLTAKTDMEIKAANYFKHLINDTHGEAYTIVAAAGSTQWKIIIKQTALDNSLPNLQYYTITFDEGSKTITLSSAGQLGLLYGVVTFFDLISPGKKGLKALKSSVTDYPQYRRRLFVADPEAQDIPSLFDWALRNKLETIVLASRQHPWYEVTEEYLAILKEIKKWRDQFGGPEVMQSHNIYEGRDIVISSSDDVQALKKVIKISYEHGARKLMILSDDTPPYKFGEGYILTDETDKATFDHFEAANTYLMNDLVNWFKNEKMAVESYYVPGFYTYEEMHQGDMSLYKNTPWNDDAFGPFYRDLDYIGRNMAEEVFLVWCGPWVRSRKITVDELNDWTKNLSGRVPFLWDNTIYSHYPFTSTSMLTAWDNDLPGNFSELTAGNGMFINNDANSETGVIGGITTNDYLWDPLQYDPQQSLRTAIAREYGSDVIEQILHFKEVELLLRKTVGQRQLWFETEKLWQQIRKIRFITDKNPFYYHLNYSRLKTLRLQLRESVPKPGPKVGFIENCRALFEKREEILQEIEKIDPTVCSRLKTMTEALPDFNTIQ